MVKRTGVSHEPVEQARLSFVATSSLIPSSIGVGDGAADAKSERNVCVSMFRNYQDIWT